MPTNKQRRDAARRHLERQLERRQQRDVRRRKATLIISILATLVVIGVIIGLVVGLSGNDKSKKPTAKGSTTPAPSSTAAPLPTTACTKETGSTVSFAGLTIKGATDLKHSPTFTGKGTSEPKLLSCADLVVGKGAAATTASTATVEYIGLVYSTGKVFQTSWTTSPATFGLAPGAVIDGFSQGIAGAGKVAGMHVGGRRVIVMPAAIAYAASPPANSGIPANASLVFIVDLQKIA